jgi:hypothetical protein
MTLSGITVNFPNIPVYLRWLYWGNHMTYLVSAELLVVFEGITTVSSDGVDEIGVEYLDMIGIQVQNFWLDVGISVAFLGVYRILTYLSLRFLHRES